MTEPFGSDLGEAEPPTPEETAAAVAVDPVHDDDCPLITTYDESLPTPPSEVDH